MALYRNTVQPPSRAQGPGLLANEGSTDQCEVALPRGSSAPVWPRTTSLLAPHLLLTELLPGRDHPLFSDLLREKGWPVPPS